MTERDVVVLSAVRSAVGTFGGGLSDLEPADLAGTVMKEAVARSGADPAQINYVTVGNCIPTEKRYPYVARIAAIQAGLPMESVAMTILPKYMALRMVWSAVQRVRPGTMGNANTRHSAILRMNCALDQVVWNFTLG